MKKIILSTLLIVSFLLVSFPLSLIASAEDEVGNYPTPESVTNFATLNGAAVRMNNQDETVLSFRAAIKKSYVTELQASNPDKMLTFGVLVVRKSTMELANLTPIPVEILACNYIEWYATESFVEDLETVGDSYLFYGTSGKIDYSNMYEDYIGLSYVRVTDRSGSSLILNAPYSATNNVRSAYQVSLAALQDTNANYGTRFQNNMQSYLEKVILLETEGSKIVSKNDLYTISSGSTPSYLSIRGESLSDTSKISVYLDGEQYLEDNLPNAEITLGNGNVLLSLTPIEKTSTNASTISLLPEKVVTWANFEKALTLNPKITNSTFTKTDLKYISSNPSVVTVDGTGSIKAQSEGFAKIYAYTPDGSYATMDVEITEAQVRAEDQKLTLGSTTRNRIAIARYWNWPSPAYEDSFGDVGIALWKGNALGACAITIDDSIVNQFEDWNYVTKATGIPVTFIVPGNLYTQSSHQKGWNAAIAAGNAVQSHSFAATSNTVYDTWTTAQVWMDYYNGITSVESVTNVPVHVIGYSYGWAKQDLASELFIGGRGATGLINQAAKINYTATNSLSCSNGSAKIRSFANIRNDLACVTTNSATLFNENYYGGFVSYHWHGVNTSCITDTKANGSSFTSARDYLLYLFQNVLGPYKEDGSVWFGTFEEVMLYGQERDTATVKVLSVSDEHDEVHLSLTDKMDDSIFTYPLTIKLRVDSTWTKGYAYQNGNTMSCDIVVVEEDSCAGTYAVFEMVPDAGELTLLKG